MLQQKTLKPRFFFKSFRSNPFFPPNTDFLLVIVKNFLLVIADKLFFFFFFWHTGVWLTLQLLGGIQFIFISRHWERESSFSAPWNWARHYYIGFVERTVLCQFWCEHLIASLSQLSSAKEARWFGQAIRLKQPGTRRQSPDNVWKLWGPSAYWREVNICPAKPLKG